MAHTRRGLGVFTAAVLCLALATGTSAQLLRPHEPLNPGKAQSLPLTPLSIQTKTGLVDFQVEVADDDQERSTGLMHRSELAHDRGMLFNFFTPRPVSFWMRNTFIPLDMIFIGTDGTILAIAENTVPHNEKGVGPGSLPVMAVLELAGGVSKTKGIALGDKITHAIFAR